MWYYRLYWYVLSAIGLDGLFTHVLIQVKGSSNDILGKGSCGSWGYAGGSLEDRNHKSNRISSRNAVFLQEQSKTEQQDIEFFFCKDTIIQTAQVFPLHSGHELLRGILQYFKDGK